MICRNSILIELLFFFRYNDFKDNDEEFTSVERTHTTKTEKITTNRRSRSIGKNLDLGAASGFGQSESQVCESSLTVNHSV